MKPTLIALLAFCLASSGAFAKPARSGAEPGVLETLTGHVDVINQGQTIVMKLAGGSGDRWFRVETNSLTPLPDSFSTDSAEILYWQGHLLLRVPQARKAFHFLIPDFKPPKILAPVADGLGPVRTASALDDLLAGYEVTRIDTATVIASAQGPRARLSISVEGKDPKPKVFYQPPSPGGGPSGCGTSCSIACGDGSSCSVNCASPRCASCSCPASCTCGL
jgi:hypothetical protein